MIDDARRRLTTMADDPPYRFLDTSRGDAQAYQQRKKTFLGHSNAELAAAETRLGVTFPAVFRGYLSELGKACGDLFCGSDLADLASFQQFRLDAEELLRDSNVQHQLPENAIVFLFHQGYSFAFIVADGGLDCPVFQYVEGDEHWSQATAEFAEFVDLEIRLAEQNHHNFHDQGGYYVSIDSDGYASQIYPALADGKPPLDGPDRFTD